MVVKFNDLLAHIKDLEEVSKQLWKHNMRLKKRRFKNVAEGFTQRARLAKRGSQLTQREQNPRDCKVKEQHVKRVANPPSENFVSSHASRVQARLAPSH